MRIGIDARLFNQTGVGRYIRNLIRILGDIDKENYYLVFLRQEDQPLFKLPNNHWQVRIVNVCWHSFLEQLIMPPVLYKERLDIVHFPYFNIPLLYFKPFIVTIHDLTHLYFDTGRASTLPAILYKIKRVGLKIALWWGINKSKKIITVSEATKNEILKNYQIKPEKIVVTYEGVALNKRSKLPPSVASGDLRRASKNQNQNLKLKTLIPYLLYIGNAYPHKNLEWLITAYKELILNNQRFNNLRLVLVGPDDFFYQRLINWVKDRNLERKVVFYGPASDSELNLLYQQAICLVLPSLMEGFGLVGLEAMSQGCPVLASDIPSLREIYQEAAIYFNPLKISDIKVKIEMLINSEAMRGDLINKGKERIKSFSWLEMGERTKEIYNSSF